MFADDMTLYIENPKDATRKLLEIISEFGRVAGYKINAHKSLAFIYTKVMKNLEEKLRKCSHLPLQQKRIKHVGINLPKETKDLYAENDKTLMKEIR